MYEVMRGPESAPSPAAASPLLGDFAEIWQAADKIVYSRSLAQVSTARTRIERHFDPDAVRQLKAQAPRDVTVAGPDLAAHAFKAGLVDELQLFVAPSLVGGGTRSLPDGVRLDLELLEERRFGNRMV